MTAATPHPAGPAPGGYFPIDPVIDRLRVEDDATGRYGIMVMNPADPQGPLMVSMRAVAKALGLHLTTIRHYAVKGVTLWKAEDIAVHQFGLLPRALWPDWEDRLDDLIEQREHAA